MNAAGSEQPLGAREYRYPRQWALLWRLLFGLPALVVLVRFALGWGEAILTLLQEMGAFPASAIRADFVDLSHNTWSLFFLILLLYFFYNAFPQLRVTPTHLEVSSFRGWIPVAWEQVTRLISTEGEVHQRRVALIQLAPRALPLGYRLAYSLQGALYGVGFVPGLLVLSDLIGFDELMESISSRLRSQSAAAEPITLDPQPEPSSPPILESYFSPLWQVVFQPQASLQRLMENLAELETRPTIRLNLLLAAAPVVLFVMSSQLFGHSLWGVLFVVAVALVEGLLGPFNLWALSDLFVHFPRIGELARIYPYAQIPRTLFFLPLALGLVVRPPLVLWGGLWLAQAAWSARQARLLAEETYGHPGSPLTWLGGVVAVILHLVILFTFISFARAF